LTTFEETLAHFGIKGMKWGVRRTNPGASSPGASEDSKRVSDVKSKVKIGGTKALTNQELKVLVDRMNLEKQFKSLQPPSNTQKAGKFVADILVQVGKQQLMSIAASVATKQVAAMLKK
jgi:hypothetical protein